MNKVENFLETTGFLTISIWKMLLTLIKTPLLFFPTFVIVGFGNYMTDYRRFVEALAICIVADSVFGVWLAFKEDRFEMSKSFAIVQKIVVYSFYLMIIHFISRLDWISEFDSSVIYITKFFLTAMILTEGKSAVENGNMLFPNKIAGTIVWFFEKIEGRMSDKVKSENNRQQHL